MEQLLTCCRHTPPLAPGTRVINVCPGCDRRYREDYDRPSTISLWELLLETDGFVFPDYGGQAMTIIDACPTRDQDRIHDAVRGLAAKMNIRIVEPARTRRQSTCCGDVLFGHAPAAEVVQQMQAKAAEMPLDDIVVYCVSCAKAMFVGGRRPRYLVDLLFGEETVPQTIEPEAWHGELEAFVETHRG